MFKTERALVGTLGESDAPALRSYLLENVEHHKPWEPAREPGYYSLDNVEHRIREYTRQQRVDNALTLAAFSRDGTEIVALLSFTNVVRGVFLACNLGFSISRSCEGKGMMYEILSAAIDHVFNELNLRRIMANYMPHNVRSAALLSRLGFEKEGMARSYLKIAGVWQDHVLTSRIAP